MKNYVEINNNKVFIDSKRLEENILNDSDIKENNCNGFDIELKDVDDIIFLEIYKRLPIYEEIININNEEEIYEKDLIYIERIFKGKKEKIDFIKSSMQKYIDRRLWDLINKEI